MNGIKLNFELKSIPFFAIAHKNGRKTLEIEALDSSLTVSVAYSQNRRMLSLNGEVKEGDKVEVVIYDVRIELYVNSVLADEEWCMGKRFFDLGDEFLPSGYIFQSAYEKSEVPEPNVIATFENAEGWRPGGGVFVGDCMPYVKNDEYHVLYLKDRHHHRSKWGMGAHQWEHISTKDFKTWQIHPMAVPISKDWEASICTGSWINKGTLEHLYYTVRRANGLPAIITRSISSDGYHFKKDEGFGFTVSEKFHSQSARDPKVFFGEDGKYHMILTTSLTTPEKNGCLAHFTSPDLEVWQEAEKPIYVVPNGDQPECPDYFKYRGKYYLVFSLRGRARYLVSSEPFDNFVSVDDELIPCAGVPKCAEWNGSLVFTGFKVIDGYAGTMTFKEATSAENGKLIFKDLRQN